MNNYQTIEQAFTMPANTEAEEKLLSCILTCSDGSTLRNIQEFGVSPIHFYNSENAKLFNLIQDAEANQYKTDLEGVVSFGQAKKRLEEVGGFARLVDITSNPPMSYTWTGFAEAISDAWQRRKTIKVAQALIRVAGHEKESFKEALNAQCEVLLGIGMTASDHRTWEQSVMEAKEEIQDDMLPYAQRKRKSKITWGFPSLDKAFQPFEFGELVVIAARTSNGKSSLARQIWLANAVKGIPSKMDTLEVTDAELARNMVANISGVRSRRDLHILPEPEKKRLLDACDALAKSSCVEVVDDEPSIHKMLASTRAFKRKHGSIGLWVIDYLGLIREAKETAKGMTLAASIGVLTSQLKAFAQKEQCVIILLVQINRAGDEMPTLANLKDSGCVEDDANRVIIIHRPKSYCADDNSPEIIQDFNAPIEDTPRFMCNVMQAKGRNHGTGSVPMWFKRETASFEEISYSRNG